MPSYAQFDVWQSTAGVSKPACINSAQFVTTNNTYYSGTSNLNSPVQITDMNYTYTPIASGSKILIMFDVIIGQTSNDSASVRFSINGSFPFIGVTNSGGYIGYSSQSSYVNNTSASNFNYCGRYLYQNTGLTALSLVMYGYEQGGSFYLNRSYSYDDSARARGPSTWTILEFQP
jgi:hypothetical protein